MNKSNGVYWPTLVKTLQRIDDAIGPEPTTPAIARPYGRGTLDPRFAVVPVRVAEVPPAPPTPSQLQAAPTLGVAPAPAETLELADQLAEHGGHDETFVADAIRDAIAAAADPALTTVAEIRPPDGESIYDNIVDLAASLDPPPEPLKLTRAQINALPKASPQPFDIPSAPHLGIPVIEVDTVEESTPYKIAAAAQRSFEDIHRDVVIAEVLRPAPTDTSWLAVEPAAAPPCTDCGAVLLCSLDCLDRVATVQPAPPSRRGWLPAFLRRPR